MKWMLAGIALATLSMTSLTTARATVCSDQCNRNYGACNNLNGANGQQLCMPRWMQCKKTCAAPPKPTKVLNVSRTPRP